MYRGMHGPNQYSNRLEFQLLSSMCSSAMVCGCINALPKIWHAVCMTVTAIEKVYPGIGYTIITSHLYTV